MIFRMKKSRFRKKITLACVLFLIGICLFKYTSSIIPVGLDFQKSNEHDPCGVYGCIDDYIDFEDFDNTNGVDRQIVPNIVHLIYLNNTWLRFHEAICIFSIYLNHKPSLIYIHCNNCSMHGKYWDWLKMDKNLWNIIKLNEIRTSGTIFGATVKWVHHKSDVLRLLVLMNYGGFYFDNDMFIIKSLQHYRKYEMTVSMSGPNGTTTGCQIMIAHKNARLLKAHYDVYRTNYKRENWYWNCGFAPGEILVANKSLNLAHVANFATHENYMYKLFTREWDGWRDLEAIHLLMSYRWDYDKSVMIFNETNILEYNRTFGHMARDIMKRMNFI